MAQLNAPKLQLIEVCLYERPPEELPCIWADVLDVGGGTEVTIAFGDGSCRIMRVKYWNKGAKRRREKKNKEDFIDHNNPGTSLAQFLGKHFGLKLSKVPPDVPLPPGYVWRG
jgi:hypothetical protein